MDFLGYYMFLLFRKESYNRFSFFGFLMETDYKLVVF